MIFSAPHRFPVVANTQHTPAFPNALLPSAPKWRHSTFMPLHVSDERRFRLSLRLDPHLMKEIDRDRRKRAGRISRNTWITEAVLEKLSHGQMPAKTKRFPDA